MSIIEIDAASLARVIREQEALPITGDEAEGLARAIETSIDDEQFLISAVSAIRLLVERLEYVGRIDQADADTPTSRCWPAISSGIADAGTGRLR
jgi:hypothetical protein